jgi:hypothetical protein
MKDHLSKTLQSKNTWMVITSIYPPRAELLQSLDLGWSVVVVGDLKTPKKTWSEIKAENFFFLTTEDQVELFPEFSEQIGFGTYARKNIGYLFAISKGAQAIWDTDDDTYIRAPARQYFSNIDSCEHSRVSGSGFFNPYTHFAPGSELWPRGYPLRNIFEDKHKLSTNLEIISTVDPVDFDILQTLVNIEPDLDAIYRMTVGDEPIDIQPTKEILSLNKEVFSPGNTQSTLWVNPEKFAYLYIPRWVTFRFCDILKMYIAQSRSHFSYAGFWSEQYRNPHDYMMDFESEVQCFLNTERLVSHVSTSNSSSLFEMYTELANIGICTTEEVVAASLFEKIVLEMIQ